jgi:hypothetical protein
MWKLRTSLATALLLVGPALILYASEGLDLPEALEKTVSLEGLTGLNLFLARAYNEQLWLYAICCTATMAVVGMVIAFLTDRLLKVVGIEVHKIEHRE